MQRFTKLKCRAAMMIPVIACALLGLVLANLTMSDSPRARAQVFDQVERVEAVAEVINDNEIQATDNPALVAERLDAKSQGAGFQPGNQTGEDCPCPCPCLTEDQVRDIVRSEIEKHCLDVPIAPRTDRLMPYVAQLGFAKEADAVTATAQGETKIVMYTVKGMRCSACDYVKRRKVPGWRNKGYNVSIVEVNRSELDSPDGKIPYFDVCEDGGCRRLSYSQMMGLYQPSTRYISPPQVQYTTGPVYYEHVVSPPYSSGCVTVNGVTTCR